MSTKFVATGTQIVASMALGVGAKRACVRAGWYADAGVTGAAVNPPGLDGQHHVRAADQLD